VADPPGTQTPEIQARIELPDALWQLPPDRRESGLWQHDGLCRMDGVGAFVGCLMPVRLSGDTALTFGVWLAVPAEALDRARRVWGTPEYTGLRLTGTLANAVQPWGGELLDAPAHAEVRDPDRLPYLAASDHPLLSRVLGEVWDRDGVLSALAFPLPVAVRHRLDERWSIERSAGMVPRVVRGRQQFTGTGRKVLMSGYATPPEQGAEEVLRMVMDGAAPLGEPVTERDGDGRHIRYAMCTTAEVDGRTQHELYGFTIGPGGFLETVCIHDDPADAAWALHVWRSVRQHR
jgi:phage protein U